MSWNFPQKTEENNANPARKAVYPEEIRSIDCRFMNQNLNKVKY